jgi:hypothetical protein
LKSFSFSIKGIWRRIFFSILLRWYEGVTMNIQRFFTDLAVLFFAFSLMGCSDSGGEGDMRTPDDPSGKFLNGQVEGLGYESHTWRDGMTDKSGEFIYAPGEMITFSVGGISLGTIEGTDNITPLDLSQNNADGTNPAAVNMTRFLMSLDYDGNPGNGIVISEETSEALADMKLDFSSTDFDQQATAIIESLDAGQIIPEEDGPRELVSAADAEAYLTQAVVAIEAEEEAAAEDAAKFECRIESPGDNVILIQGERINLQGFAKGGSGVYTYQWLLGNQVISTSLNPGSSFSSLSPGTYELIFKVVDSDGVQGSDSRLVTVLDPSAYPLPTHDEGMLVDIEHDGELTIQVGEKLRLHAVIIEGNPPFTYSWVYPSGVNYAFGDDPLDAVFTFPGKGVYMISMDMEDTRFDNLGPDFWNQSVNVRVVE